MRLATPAATRRGDAMTRVFLKIPQILKLNQFYNEHRNEVMALSRKEVAEMAKEFVKFDVTEHNIRTFEEGMGIKRKRIHDQKSDDLAAIVIHMIEFMHAMSYKVPKDLLDLLDKLCP